MSLYPIQPSFAGGELSPSLWGRVDLNKYAVGLRRLENFIVHPHGGVSRRPGMRYVALAKGSCRLVAFQHSLEQAYVLEFGDKYIRFFKGGAPVMANGVPYEIATPYSEAEVWELGFTQSADVLFICHERHVPMELTRYNDTFWTLSKFKYKNGPFTAPSEDQSNITMQLGAVRGSTTLQASADLFNASSVGNLFELTHHADETVRKETRSASGDVATESHTLTLQTTSKLVDIIHNEIDTEAPYYVYIWYWVLPAADRDKVAVGDNVSYTDLGGTTHTGTVTSISYISPDSIGDGLGEFTNGAGNYAVRTTISQLIVMPEFDTVTFSRRSSSAWGVSLTCFKSWNLETNGFWHGTFCLERFDEDEGRWVVMKTYMSPNSPSSSKNFADSGEFDEPTQLRITSVDFTPFIPSGNTDDDKGYVLLKTRETMHSGCVRVTGFVSERVVNVDVTKECVSTAQTRLWRECCWNQAAGYPRAVGFYQERICFASTPKEPQTVWMSKTGDYYDFGVSSPVVDDDAVSATLAARQVSSIRHFVPLSDLLLLTSGSEWKLSAGSKSDVVSPTSIAVSSQGYRGSSLIEPIVIGNMILFVQTQGSRLRDLGYTFESDSYTGNDLTVMATHLFSGHRIIDMTYQQEPDSVCWVVRDDGALLSMTYLREHEVVAWARHPTDGKVESIASVSGTSGDDVYLVVLRGGVRCIEMMKTVPCTEAKEAFYLDCAVTVRSDSGVSSVTGLERLNGQSVSILADGSARNNAVVKDGTVQITPAAKVVHVGLPFASKLETLDLNVQRNDGTQLTRKVRVGAVSVRVENTRGLWAGTDEEHLLEQIDRTSEPYGTPTDLTTADCRLTLDSRYDSGRVVLVCKGALPASIMAIVPEVDLGG